MLISTLILEVILTNFQVLQNLVKAEKLQTVSHLAASISHEVRNPLTASKKIYSKCYRMTFQPKLENNM